MKKLIILIIALVPFYCLYAQDDPIISSKKIMPNMASLKTVDGRIQKGWFYQLNDSQMVLLDKLNQHNKINDNSSIGRHYYNIDQVQSLSLRKKNSVMKGFLIGLGFGILTGVITGFVSGDDKIEPLPPADSDPFGIGTAFVSFSNSFAMTAGEKAVFGAIGFGTVGAITGILIGAIAKKKFIIGGSKKRVRDLEGELRQRLLIN